MQPGRFPARVAIHGLDQIRYRFLASGSAGNWITVGKAFDDVPKDPGTACRCRSEFQRASFDPPQRFSRLLPAILVEGLIGLPFQITNTAQ